MQTHFKWLIFRCLSFRSWLLDSLMLIPSNFYAAHRLRAHIRSPLTRQKPFHFRCSQTEVNSTSVRQLCDAHRVDDNERKSTTRTNNVVRKKVAIDSFRSRCTYKSAQRARTLAPRTRHAKCITTIHISLAGTVRISQLFTERQMH